MFHEDPQNNSSDSQEKRTTNDVRREAEEALRLFAALQQEDRGNFDPKSGIFELGMILRLEIQGSDAPLL
ncbi:MAG TPA: hypothetical protein VHL11_24330, partial [Phototrophicaceae bacterium]|nr:hypothetical protein [Phototrophicaceae bacterium]